MRKGKNFTFVTNDFSGHYSICASVRTVGLLDACLWPLKTLENFVGFQKYQNQNVF